MIKRLGLESSSLQSLTAEELALLNIIKDTAGLNGLAKIFDVNTEGAIVALIDGSKGLSAEDLMERLDMLVDKGLLRSEFDAKILTCGRCGSRQIMPKTACFLCGSEDVVKSSVYVHKYGALIPKVTVSRLWSCPKCGGDLGSVQDLEHGFVCNACSTALERLRVLVECLSCGWSDVIENTGQVILKRYGMTEEGLSILISADPVKTLIRRLVSEGFTVIQDVKVRGISGVEYVLDIVAVNIAKYESKIYLVFKRVGFVELLDTAVKKLDIGKNPIEKIVGNIRWVAAGPEVESGAEQIAKTFNIEVELI